MARDWALWFTMTLMLKPGSPCDGVGDEAFGTTMS